MAAFGGGGPGNVVAIGRHIAVQKKVAIADDTWPLVEVETARLHSVTTDSGTALELAGNGSYAREAVIAYGLARHGQSRFSSPRNRLR